MKINHYVLVKLGNENIGLFEKAIEMPCLPHVGTKVKFGEAILKTVSSTIESLSFSENEGVYSAHHVIDVKDRRFDLGEYIEVDYYPKLLVNECGFKVCWLEESHENIASKLKIKST
jgi:hypothetical protein